MLEAMRALEGSMTNTAAMLSKNLRTAFDARLGVRMSDLKPAYAVGASLAEHKTRMAEPTTPFLGLETIKGVFAARDEMLAARSLANPAAEVREWMATFKGADLFGAARDAMFGMRDEMLRRHDAAFGLHDAMLGLHAAALGIDGFAPIASAGHAPSMSNGASGATGPVGVPLDVYVSAIGAVATAKPGVVARPMPTRAPHLWLVPRARELGALRPRPIPPLAQTEDSSTNCKRCGAKLDAESLVWPYGPEWWKGPRKVHVQNVVDPMCPNPDCPSNGGKPGSHLRLVRPDDE
jgi:hypothetical protein